MKNLAIIPARLGSKGIPRKNIRLFLGKPLIAYTIKQAQEVGIFDRIVVDTESEEVAKIAKKYGAEVPYLRPQELAGNNVSVVDSTFVLLKKLQRDSYVPEIITLLQATSPLREVGDILKCQKIIERGNINSVCTICQSHPRLYHLNEDHRLVLVNRDSDASTNRQEVKMGYILNGCMVYMLSYRTFLKTKKFVSDKTYGVVCPKWRSVDLDEIEDWVLAEYIYKNKAQIEKEISFK